MQLRSEGISKAVHVAGVVEFTVPEIEVCLRVTGYGCYNVVES